MSSSRVDFSAEFGGDDAAEAVLPHFRALKAASKELRLDGFSFPLLAFILRVDGEVKQYHLSGAGNLEIDRKGKYLSVDIGLGHNDRDRIPDVVTSAILSSIELIREETKAKSLKVNFASLEMCLLNLVAGYKNQLACRLPENRAR
jgi:hypothetical protein